MESETNSTFVNHYKKRNFLLWNKPTIYGRWSTVQ